MARSLLECVGDLPIKIAFAIADLLTLLPLARVSSPLHKLDAPEGSCPLFLQVRWMA